MRPPGKQHADSRGGDSAPLEERSPERSLVVPLGAFTAEAVDALAKDKDRTVEETMTEAVRGYLAGVRENEVDWGVPAVLAEFEPAEAGRSAHLGLDSGEIEALEAEAARQGVSVERLAEQAVIVAYAELNRRRS